MDTSIIQVKITELEVTKVVVSDVEVIKCIVDPGVGDSNATLIQNIPVEPEAPTVDGSFQYFDELTGHYRSSEYRPIKFWGRADVDPASILLKDGDFYWNNGGQGSLRVFLDDLWRAIGAIDDNNSSSTTTYSSDKINSVINDAINDNLTSQKNQPNGIAGLGSDGKLPGSLLPALSIVNVYVVDSNIERDTLEVQTGDVAKVTSTNRTYIYDGTDWIEVSAGGEVLTVNGEIGHVQTIDDITPSNTKSYSSNKVLSLLSNKVTHWGEGTTYPTDPAVKNGDSFRHTVDGWARYFDGVWELFFLTDPNAFQFQDGTDYLLQDGSTLVY